MKFLTIATPEYDFSFWYVGTRAGAPTIAPTTTTYNHYMMMIAFIITLGEIM